jgi:DeoR family glycerol-3-phosphate regulon repressor
VKVAQAIIENARKVILVADSTKFQISAPVRIAHISQVDSVVTDAGVPRGFQQLCRDNDVDVIRATP